MEKAECHSDAPTVRQALREATASLSDAGIESACLDTELLLAEALGLDRSKFYLHYEAPLEARAEERFRSLLARRVDGEPAAYITGRREFWSLDFLVTPAVLVPRPETEMLVEVAVGLFEAESQISDRKFQILDLGTGSGAISISLAREIANAEVWATDVSSDALEIARANARRHGFERKIHFLSGDVFEPVRDRPEFFDMIISNPPYVRSDEIDALPRDVRDFEPRVALDGGADGLDCYRRIIPGALRYLSDGGFLALEIGAEMGLEVARLFVQADGYTPPRRYRDYAGRDRVVRARKLAQV
jgi:release factor glutamine methyltransferase